MSHERGIVQPVCDAHSPSLGPFAILTATETDFHGLRRRLELPDTRRFFVSRCCYDAGNPQRPCLVGPLTGSPYAVMVLETLRAWGVNRFLFMGWCGAIHGSVKTGDVIVPRSAIIDEGTSPHYNQLPGASIESDAAWTDGLCRMLRDRKLDFHQGPVWTTDALFRETPGKIEHFRTRGALAVEMELSALLSVARFYTMPAAAVLVVSDELATLQWRPGFKDAAFKYARSTLCELLSHHTGDVD